MLYSIKEYAKTEYVKLIESRVESCIRRYLKKHGWIRITKAKHRSEHGIDIKAYQPKICRSVQIEVKGGSKYPHQAFYYVLGQLLSRMDIEGNRNNKGRIYAIGIPYSWASVYRRKIQKMKFGWKLVRPKVYLVKWNGVVTEKPYTYFLRKEWSNK